VNSDIAIVAVVGDRMRGMPGIAGRTFSALGKRGINIIAIAQGSSEYNVSFVVDTALMGEAVQELHKEFGLTKSGFGEIAAMEADGLGRGVLETAANQNE